MQEAHFYHIISLVYAKKQKAHQQNQEQNRTCGTGKIAIPQNL
jgi:hypothetical protein